MAGRTEEPDELLTMALEMSEPYTSAPCSAKGIDRDPVPHPAQGPSSVPVVNLTALFRV